MPKELKIIEETDGDFYSIDSKGYHQIVLFPSNGCSERGIYFYETKQGYTHASRHENLKDILSTTTHENIHQAIDLCHEWEIEDEDEISHTDDISEHRIIRRMLWADEYLGITNKELGLDELDFSQT